MTMDTVAVDGVSMVVGVCNSGKSHLIRYNLYMHFIVQKTFDFVIVYTNSPQDYPFINSKYIHAGYNDEDLKKVLRFMRDLKAQGIEKKLLIVFDDVLGMVSFNSKIMTILNTQFRKFNISIIYSVQFLYKHIPLIIREQAYKAAFFKQTSEQASRAIWETYGQRYGRFRDFQQFVDKNTDDHQFIAVDNRAASSKRNHYHILKTPPHIPEFYIDY